MSGEVRVKSKKSGKTYRIRFEGDTPPEQERILAKIAAMESQGGATKPAERPVGKSPAPTASPAAGESFPGAAMMAGRLKSQPARPLPPRDASGRFTLPAGQKDRRHAPATIDGPVDVSWLNRKLSAINGDDLGIAAAQRLRGDTPGAVRTVRQMLKEQGAGAVSAGGRAAARGVVPAVGGLRGGAMGASLGAKVPAPPVVKASAALLGGALGAFGGGALISEAQDTLLHGLLGDEGYQALQDQQNQDAAAHPDAVHVGALAPFLATRSPLGTIPQRMAGAGLSAGLGAGQALVQGRHYGVTDAAIDAGAGGIAPTDNSIGRRLALTGSRFRPRPDAGPGDAAVPASTPSEPPPLSPAEASELRGLWSAENPKPGTDWNPLHSLMSPLSIVGAHGETLRTGSYERLGGETGRRASDLLRAVQVSAGEGHGLDQASVLAARRIALKAKLPELQQTVSALRAGKGTPDGLPRPGLAEAIEAHVKDIAQEPKPYEVSYGKALDKLTGGRVQDADGALRRHVDKVLAVGNLLRLRFNVKSSLVNLTQPLETLWPFVSTEDYAKVAADYLRPQTRRRLVALGVLDGGGKLEGARTALVEPGSKLARSRLGQVAASVGDKLPATVKDPFGSASSANRGIGYLYGEMAARRAGVTDPKQLHQAGMGWAERVEFDSGFNAPPLLRDTAARFLLQYKGFTLKSLESILGPESITRGTMPPVERLARLGKWFAAKGAVGGAKALGGPVGAGLAVWSYVQARDRARKAGASQDLAEQVGRAVALGLPSLGGADVSGSVGVLDPPFGDTTAEQALNFLAGPNVGDAIDAVKSAQELQEARQAQAEDAEAKGVDWARIAGRFTSLTRSVQGGRALLDRAHGKETMLRFPADDGSMVEVPSSLPEQLAVTLGAPVARRSMGYLQADQKRHGRKWQPGRKSRFHPQRR